MDLTCLASSTEPYYMSLSICPNCFVKLADLILMSLFIDLAIFCFGNIRFYFYAILLSQDSPDKVDKGCRSNNVI